jgi:formylglycine-generating enzyme required for sulfatase activity
MHMRALVAGSLVAVAITAVVVPVIAVGARPSSAGPTGLTSPPATAEAASSASTPPGMVWVPAGRFTMGWDGPEGRYDERPAHPVEVDGFWIDVHEVTNDQFAAFVAATGYLTTAERPIDWEELRAQLPEGTPRPPDEVLVPGSVVFTPPAHAVDLRDFQQWWTWTPGASWRHPEGPGSSIAERGDHPVVHVSWDDAVAYADWAGKRLPTEAEWERAARFGREGARFVWGEELLPEGRHMANIWQGTFPHRNTLEDGHRGTAPVGTYPPNELGLVDMAGNVWEWTLDQFRPDSYARRLAELEPGTCCSNPTGPSSTADPRNPYAAVSRVQKGGSFLCHASYCESYRPSAKMASPPDSGMGHLGFRCVATPDMRAAGGRTGRPAPAGPAAR